MTDQLKILRNQKITEGLTGPELADGYHYEINPVQYAFSAIELPEASPGRKYEGIPIVLTEEAALNEPVLVPN